jgi:hypothetical protein
MSVASARERSGDFGNLGVRVRARQIAVVAALAMAISMVNAISTNADFAARHIRIAGWEPFIWELTSWAGLLIGLPAILAADKVLASSRRTFTRAAIVLALGVAYFVLHVAAMTALRSIVYGLAGQTYGFGPLAGGLVYEGRKDAMTFLEALLVLWLWRRAITAPRPAVTNGEAPGAVPSFLAESRGGRVIIRAPEIDWVEAQGNYVALHTGGESYLIRQPLKTVDVKLRGAAFVRTHRSALVNTRRVRGIQRSDAGGLRVELANQQFAPLSDRHKAAVVRALATG